MHRRAPRSRAAGTTDPTTPTVTVKLGPVKMTYRGTIAIVESDPEARTATMLAKGAEERGQGTAQATLNMSVTETRGRRLARAASPPTCS